GVHAEDVGEPSAGETVRLRTLRLRHQAVDVRGSARDVPDSDADPHAPVYRSETYDTIERAGPGKRARRRPGVHPAMPCCRWAWRRSMWRVLRCLHRMLRNAHRTGERAQATHSSLCTSS